MASIRKQFSIAASADKVWQALRAVGEVHRFAPGFVTDCRMDGDDVRVVTFANGFVTRELIVDLDDQARRLAYSARSERLQHHHATFQVMDDGPGRCTVLWIADVLPLNTHAVYVVGKAAGWIGQSGTKYASAAPR